MASSPASSSAPPGSDKPVIVRIKRKANQSRLDAFWLEINERPLKRPLLDFGKLSLSDSSAKVEELKSRKVFVQHVDTVTTSEVTTDILQPFVSHSAAGPGSKEKTDTRRSFKTENKQEQLLSKAKQHQEILSKNARFEQIWRSRKVKDQYARDEACKMCHLYDIVRVEVKSSEKHEEQSSELEDIRMMSDYLPLLREVLPSAAAEVEQEILDTHIKRALPDNYVYDYYAVKDDMDITEESGISPFPLVKVEEEEFYDGPDDSDYETDDSNAEGNPMNDYPDEESSDEKSSGTEYEKLSGCSDDESETGSRSSGHESEGENSSQTPSKHEMLDSDGAYPLSEGETIDDYVDWDAYDEEFLG
ncbi:OLC1v1006397C1 [Oldenlandia corymbosa var. corymbosa]|uniref:OLC1v1006397C1 n=1 Tax=Oldenlandia corymbosa var. corymbosa TaxID=529605 RepID=A0AAV1DJG2_OLDCO|nr:OLC1v1006397C1 [Oldenlandia corymbosa var. corymbosa]